MSEVLPLLTAIFTASSALLFLTDRFSSSGVPAYIIAGVGVGMFFESQQLIGLSQLGIAFLVFIFGLKTEPERIESVAKEGLSVTLLQVAVAGAAAAVFAEGLGLDLLNTLYLVIAAALSSSLVGLDLVESEIRIDLLHGRLSESIHLIQDLIAVLAVLIVFAIPESSAVYSVLKGLAIVVAAFALRSTVFPAIGKRISGSSELNTLTGLAFLTGFTAIASILDISVIAGSFAAGIAVSRYPYNIEMLDNMGSLKDFFSAIFFVSLGALATVPTPSTVAVSVFLIALTLVIKPAITTLGLLMNGYDHRTSYLTALTLDQVSEFSLIVAIQAFAAGTIANELFNAIILSATFTMIVSTYTTRHEEKIYQAISRYSRVETSEAKIEEWTSVGELEDHIILIGYDIQGKRIAETLAEQNADFVVIENDPEKIIEAKKNEDHYVFGDVLDDTTWERAHAEKASFVVSTVPQMKVSLGVIEQQHPEEKILRAEEVEEAKTLMEMGAVYVQVPDIVASEELTDHLEGTIQNPEYREELRRQNLLELRRYLEDEEG